MRDPTLLVLASLADGEKHGYAIMLDIQGFAGLQIAPGTLYGAITRMEESGWIQAVEFGERRRPYRMTAAGRSYLKGHIASLDKVVREAMGRLRKARRD